MAAPDTTGHPVPVSLMADPFARQLAICVTSGGSFGMQNNSMNPLDMFDQWAPTTDWGIAVVILNSLAKPLTLVDIWLSSFDQQSYPAITNPQTMQTIKTHQIPAARPYPRPSKHPKGAAIGGVGCYRFTGGSGFTRGGALAFSMAEDGSSSDPLIGVAFDPNVWCLVVTDLNNHDFGAGARGSNLENLFGACSAKSSDRNSEKSTTGNGVTVWGGYATTHPANEPSMHTLVVWVHDDDSTLAVA
jgi:hypothetical protein